METSGDTCTIQNCMERPKETVETVEISGDICIIQNCMERQRETKEIRETEDQWRYMQMQYVWKDQIRLERLKKLRRQWRHIMVISILYTTVVSRESAHSWVSAHATVLAARIKSTHSRASAQVT